MSFFPLTKSFSKPLKSSVKHSRKSSSRGISEVIGALLLLAITVSIGLVVFVAVSNSEITTYVSSERGSLNPNVIPRLQITGYDTRDANSLDGLDEVCNLGDDECGGTSPGDVDFLCAASCIDGETEFIILRVRNPGNIVVEITSISINEVEHTWYDAAGVNPFAFTTLPGSGEFIIISGYGAGSLIQEITSFLPAASEKRLVIRLDDSASLPDITLNSNIRVIINSSVETTQLILVPAGSLI